eukprot:scaffold3863_cov263-Chaetoceros_neogracile.AAC.8
MGDGSSDSVWSMEYGYLSREYGTMVLRATSILLRGRLIGSSEKKRINWLLRELSYDKKC